MSISTNDIYRELDLAANSMQDMRGQAFSEAEKALALHSFATWLMILISGEKGEEFYMYPNDSARTCSLLYVYSFIEYPKFLPKVKALLPDFNPQLEITIGSNRMHYGSEEEMWNNSTTRAIIMITRSLAYRYTRHAGNRSSISYDDLTVNDLLSAVNSRFDKLFGFSATDLL